MNVFSILARFPDTIPYGAPRECFPGSAVVFIGPGH